MKWQNARHEASVSFGGYIGHRVNKEAISHEYSCGR